MAIADYGDHDALGLAELVRKGEVSASELLEAAIEQTEALNPRINAVVSTCFDAARARAADNLPDTPIAGVPFLIKDLTYLDGLPSTSGSRLFAEYVPDHDAEIVRRYKRAGLIIFGKTNTPEFGLTVTTEPKLFGPCRNPWHLDRTTGGSSGGAASAVAAGILPVAHATDGGGSIRIPASCCGLVGLKPTRARNPQGPDVGEGWNGMSTGHVVSRSVRDSAAFLDATFGPAAGDPYFAPHFEGSFLSQCAAAPGKLKIAVDLNALTGAGVDPACRTAVEMAARLCESLGHHVEAASPAFDRLKFGQAASQIVAPNVANLVDARLAALGRPLAVDDIEPVTRGVVEIGRQVLARDYAAAVQVIHQTGRAVAEFHEHYDVMLTPTLLAPPVPIGWLDTDNPTQHGERFPKFWGFTNLQNATGQPAISLPLHWSDDGLPVGVQFVGRFGEDLGLLQLATQLEVAQPWFGRRAPIS
jgi:Asp-tRNA(Asn)/Glu-tRNA(Gln) amidotransferase A subunit family amidase